MGLATSGRVTDRLERMPEGTMLDRVRRCSCCGILTYYTVLDRTGGRCDICQEAGRKVAEHAADLAEGAEPHDGDVWLRQNCPTCEGLACFHERWAAWTYIRPVLSSMNAELHRAQVRVEQAGRALEGGPDHDEVAPDAEWVAPRLAALTRATVELKATAERWAEFVQAEYRARLEGRNPAAEEAMPYRCDYCYQRFQTLDAIREHHLSCRPPRACSAGHPFTS